MTALKISRTIALIVGVILPAIETWRRWNLMADWPSWLDDYIGAALLLYSWHTGRTELTRSRPYLMAAWGYTFGMAYMSFFGQLRSAAIADPSGMPMAAVIGFKGAGMVLAATCLALAWPPRDRDNS